jgi:hypothetical protein
MGDRKVTLGTSQQKIRTSNSLGTACALLSGSGVLIAAGPPAQAAIVYSGVKNISYDLPVVGSPYTPNFGTVADLGTDFGWNYDGAILNAGFISVTSNTNLEFSYSGKTSNGKASTLYSPGQSIDSANSTYKTQNSFLAFSYDTAAASPVTSGNWSLGITGFGGFREKVGGTDYRYGWYRLTTPSAIVAGAPIALVDWAFESDLNTPILAGAGAVPAPLPALGAAAALSASRRLRRRIAAAKAAERQS